MSLAKYLLGKVFISHSAPDKPFVRRIAAALTKAGYQIWLDEHELKVGDQLGQRITEALESAKVVLVVVTPASVKSKWLRFELNHATTRMIEGKCRVIPVVRGKPDLPSEVKGLLYADFDSSFRFGMKSVLTALDHEANRASSVSFWSSQGAMVEEIFDGVGSASIDSEYSSKDFDIASIEIDEHEATVVYEIVSAYTPNSPPLNETWVKEFVDAASPLGEGLFLVISERPISFATERVDSLPESIRYRPLLVNLDYRVYTLGHLVAIDMSSPEAKEKSRDLIEAAKHLLTEKAKSFWEAEAKASPNPVAPADA